MNNNIIFDGTSRFNWIKSICEWLPDQTINKNSTVSIWFTNVESPDKFEPSHIVILACFIQYIFDLNYNKCTIKGKKSIQNFWVQDIKLPQYWGGENRTYIESETETTFNLWHVKSSEIETYSDCVHRYLKRIFFQNKDLSAIKNSLLEIYYNIFDHAEASGNNFSFMTYHKQEARLYVAVCDFGKGIAKSIRDKFTNIKSDEEALRYAIKPMVTTRSQLHNKGMGLGNILDHISGDDTLRIVSNGTVLVQVGNAIKTFDLTGHFSGTLIFYDISLNNFEDDENYRTFELDFDF